MAVGNWEAALRPCTSLHSPRTFERKARPPLLASIATCRTDLELRVAAFILKYGVAEGVLAAGTRISANKSWSRLVEFRKSCCDKSFSLRAVGIESRMRRLELRLTGL